MKISGVALRPGVSRNNRRYTAETIKKAHARLSSRLADPSGRPVTIRTAHPTPSGTGAAVTNIVGRLTSATLTSDGAIAYEAVLADTPDGKTVAALIKPDSDGRQHLANVSIRGWWIGSTRTDKAGCEVGDDLEIDGVDLTDSPGIPQATVVAGESARRRTIYESVAAPMINNTPEQQIAAAVTEALSPVLRQVNEAIEAAAAARRRQGVREAVEKVIEQVEAAKTPEERAAASADAYAAFFQGPQILAADRFRQALGKEAA